ncbi:Rho family protein [Aspergillus lucknowensis]|uniref:P-loop containing nucleoside triphosphate hydrolase protein n=1 Tax=Aspergillus lucknowensis TaxID=176173 RepID=A0ABR4LBJ3_9EURO
MAAVCRKIVVVGDTSCGKTSLIAAFSHGTYPSGNLPTLLDLQLVDTPISRGQFRLSLWDTTDQDEFRHLRPLAYPDCDIVLICFSIDSPKSLDNAQRRWAPEVQRFCNDKPTILVGCKKDLRDQEPEKQVTSKQATKVCRKIKAQKYLECSAVTLEGVQAVFDAAAQAVLFLR